MLGKLLKYDIKFGYRQFFIMGGAMLLTAVLLRILDFDWVNSFTMITLLPFVYFGIGIACIVLVYQNFSRNLLSNEGYFMLTLPVKRYKFIVSKLITSMMWFNFMITIGFIAALILLDRRWFGGMSVHTMLFVNYFTGVFMLNILALNGILVLYLLAVGANVSFGGRKFGWWFGAVCAAAFVILEVMFITHIARPLFDGLAIWFVGWDRVHVVISSEFPLRSDWIERFSYTDPLLTQRISTSSIDIGSTLSMLLFSALAYCIIAYYLKKRVDLQ